VDPDPGGPKTCGSGGSGSGSATLLFLKPQISQNGKIFYFLNAEEKKLGQFSKNYRIFFPKKLSLNSQKYGFGIRDPRSGIRKKPIPDPGSGSRVKNASDPGSLSATLLA
jgi:hypothetical protein